MREEVFSKSKKPAERGDRGAGLLLFSVMVGACPVQAPMLLD